MNSINFLISESSRMTLGTDFTGIALSISVYEEHSHGHGPFGWWDHVTQRGIFRSLEEIVLDGGRLNITKLNGFNYLDLGNTNVPLGHAHLFLRFLNSNGRSVAMIHTERGIYQNTRQIIIRNNSSICTYSCLLTSSAVNALGKEDTCEELELLRKFRDNFIQNHYPKYIDLYYQVSPFLIEKINQRKDKKRVYETLWENYINPTCDLIRDLRLDEAFYQYKDSIRFLADTFLNMKEDSVPLRLITAYESHFHNLGNLDVEEEQELFHNEREHFEVHE